MTIFETIRRAALVAVMIVIGGSLAGCGSMIADLPVVGLPADAPQRPKTTSAFPAVHDVPDGRAAREGKMTNVEQQQIQSDLVAARARSAAAAAAK